MIRNALGFGLVYSLGIGTALVVAALVMSPPPADADGDLQHAVLTTESGNPLPIGSFCPYLAERAEAGGCPYLAERLAVAGCPYLAGRAGSGCPALGGSGSACPRAGRSAEAPPPADRAGRGVLLAALGLEPAPATAVDPT